jgi:hypothetical protein
MEPEWLMIVSWIALGLGFASALAILADEFLLGNRQHMGVMNVVHPITALYWGPVWLWAYMRNGRKSGQKVLHEQAMRFEGDADDLRRKGESTNPEDLRPWHIGNAVSHCGAGCTLGDIGGEWLLFAIGAAGVFGWELLADFVLAWTLGIAFQYATGAGSIREAIKVDTLSIVAFQVGLFGWMALSHFVLFQPPLKVDTSAHWFMMQVGMIVGYATAWPVNRWLVRRGVKEKMDHRTHLAMLVEELRGSDEPTTRERDTRFARNDHVPATREDSRTAPGSGSSSV